MLNKQKFDGRYLYLLAFVSALVLALSIINYTNLTSALTINRAKEIAVRKTNGAARIQVVIQFLIETLLLTSIGFALALVFIWMLISPLNVFTGREMTLDMLNPSWALAACAMILATAILAGIPVARSLWGYKPVQVLKGIIWQSSRSPIRNAMVVTQFTIAIALSISAISAFRQLKFMQAYDTGFNKDEVVVAEMSWVRRNYVVNLMNELRRMPGIKDVTGSLRRLGDPIDINDVIFRNTDQQSFRMPATTMWVDYNYIPFYGIKLLAGRNISPDYGSDVRGNSYLINETMAHKLLEYTADPKAELSSLVGQGFRFNFQDSLGTIVGIVQDFNFNSLHHKVEPLCISYQHDYYFKELSIRLDKQHLAETLALVESKWKEFLPNREMEYRFLDEQMDQLYKTDRQTGQIMASLTLLAIFISSFGLIALALFNTERRVKEIGIRRVLGASVSGIVLLLSNNFIKLVIAAIVIATPIAWLAIDNWLKGFAYRINIDWWTFAIAALAAVSIALLSVLWQAIRAATANPVKSLRTE
jgi:putative ABC transport system permease protein